MDEKDVLKFAKTVGKLKEIKRAGWVKRNIPDPESVADHSFRAALLGMVLSDDEGLDTEKVMRMLLLHDLEESVTGDIPHPQKLKMDKEKLKAMQEGAIKEALSPLSAKLRERYFSIWKEMEEETSQEAKFCKDVEKLEMLMQVDDYQRKSKENKDKLNAFWEEAKNINDVPRRIASVIKVYEELRRQRGI
ncbi:MAG: HD domain-containing protein [Candidatus Aenigmatarchaeota archaeon]